MNWPWLLAVLPTFLLGRSGCLLHIVSTIEYILYIVYYTSGGLMKFLSKGKSAHSIVTIELAWHNNNSMMWNMRLNDVRKSKLRLVLDLLPNLNSPYLGSIQPQARLRGVKHARETSKYTSGCLERTSLFKLRRNTQIPDIRSFSIFGIIRIWRNLWQFLPKYRLQWSKWHPLSYINPPAFV